MKIKIKTALISVYDKNNLSEILSTLKKHQVKIISSGGTYKKIIDLGFNCKEVSEYTGSPEILDGRVKTLHPKIHAGILNKNKDKIHKKQMIKLGYENIDLIIVNFYPFQDILNFTKAHDKIIDNIDIGGPTMVRAAAKNFEYKTVITSAKQYNSLKDELKLNNGKTSKQFRQKMSKDAFLETAYYEAVISNYFNKLSNDKFPSKKIIFGEKINKLRYGENPHQEASVYSQNTFSIKQLSGKKLSYNNYNDMFSAINITKVLPKNLGCVVLKHSNPCGVSINKNRLGSLKSAINCDPISAFGGIISCNFKIDRYIAKELNKIFLEIVIGKGFTNDALKILKKKKNLRLIDTNTLKKSDTNLSVISRSDNLLIQESDDIILDKKNFKVVSKIKPNKNVLNNLIFAFNVCRFVKSNAIVISKNLSTIGIGSGQTSRLDSCDIAINKMRKFKLNDLNDNICAASDAFFPFTDGVEKLAVAGIKAIIQPSGSIRDKEIIKLANKLGLILVFSKTRHFNH